MNAVYVYASIVQACAQARGRPVSSSIFHLISLRQGPSLNPELAGLFFFPSNFGGQQVPCLCSPTQGF